MLVREVQQYNGANTLLSQLPCLRTLQTKLFMTVKLFMMVKEAQQFHRTNTLFARPPDLHVGRWERPDFDSPLNIV